ncbi:GNAT family N-acetyltransferase [Enterococcus sp.]|uniref:GNAT family N-acetyltransferase n=1 Tax=Enterococcus sp. TaxID=35783 RepID=UPI0028A948B7|nr:GNAT family N-acetyltransferase [Enterococcus sp.]
MEIKQCTVADLEELAAISISTYKDTFDAFNTEENMRIYLEEAYNKPKLTKELNTAASAFFFLQSEGQTAGYIKINWGDAQTEAIAPNGLEVERIYIKKEYKRRGLGTVLLSHAETCAKEMGKTSIWLGVWEHNLPALAFYKKMGFEKVGSHSFFMGDDEQIDLLMEKHLI